MLEKRMPIYDSNWAKEVASFIPLSCNCHEITIHLSIQICDKIIRFSILNAINSTSIWCLQGLRFRYLFERVGVSNSLTDLQM